jgi:hypothetical protein
MAIWQCECPCHQSRRLILHFLPCCGPAVARTTEGSKASGGGKGPDRSASFARSERAKAGQKLWFNRLRPVAWKTVAAVGTEVDFQGPIP